MNLTNIERNPLDYILTDVLPTELSEKFTYRFFYDFLTQKNKEISSIIKKITEQKNNNSMIFVNSPNWVSAPLSYTIMKQLNTERVISLLQPLAAIQLFLFISVYQKEMLTLLKTNSIFSLRYHKKNNDLFYKNKNKSIIKYFDDITKTTGKEIIEQTGIYFNIGRYKSISAFTSSEEWLILNSKYKFFIRTDYKSCFDSIYTHAFKWIIGKDTNDTKNFNNGSIYATIDRVLMNINTRSSNGIVVGPEFSRMVAELLLQAIDRDVFYMLLNKKFIMGENYNIYRFVDDIFIFTDSEDLANEIVSHYSKAAQKYLLQLNELKLYKSKVPFILSNWYSDTITFTNHAISLLFYSNDDFKRTKSENEKAEPHLLKSFRITTSKKSIMNQINELVCKYENMDKTIVSYFLGALLNKVGRNKEKIKIFKKKVTSNTVFNFLELSFYIFSFFPNYTNTQKLLSIISYVKDEFDIFREKDKLQQLIDRYSFIFEKANLNDIINLLSFCCQAQIEIPYRQEEKIIKQLEMKDNPILWATYLLYSKYSSIYYKTIRNIIGAKLLENIEAIVQKDKIYTYREFWWILIFNKSPHLTTEEQNAINNILSTIQNKNGDYPGDNLGTLFVDFLKNSPNQFFEWDINNKDFLRNLTFKTRQRSIFKNYRESLPALYWSSI